MKTLVEWSKAVKLRDLICQHCGTDKDLHAHHIKHKSTNPELKLDVSNGVTLCYRCHKAEHERNRPLRLRSNAPQRKTLTKKISELESDLQGLNSIISLLQAEIKNLTNQNDILERSNSLFKKPKKPHVKNILIGDEWGGFMK